MKLTVLGCDGAYPKKGGATSGYLLQTQQANILIDCGSGVLANLNGIMDIEELDAVILTHLHHDHCSDIGAMSYELSLRGKLENPIELYLTDAPEPNYQVICSLGGFQPKVITDTITVKDITIDFLEVKHPVKTFAVRAESDGKVLTYTADSRYFDELSAFCVCSDLLLCDAAVCNADHKETTPHMSAGQAGELAFYANCSTLMLTHILPHSDLEQICDDTKEKFGNTVVAQLMRSYEI
jgi:ribonuclease BN (tRNA processing enzyme)